MAETPIQYILRNRANGMSDSEIQAQFKQEFGRSIMSVDHGRPIPPTLSLGGYGGMPVTFPTFSDVVDTAGAAVGGMAGAAVGAALPVYETIARSIGLPTSPVISEKVDASMMNAVTGPLQQRELRRDKPVPTAAVESGRDVALGMAHLYGQAIGTAAGVPPPGHVGPYGMTEAFQQRLQTGLDIASGMTGGVGGMAAALVAPKPGEPFRLQDVPSNFAAGLKADPVGLGFAAAPLAVKARAGKLKETPRQVWEKPPDTGAVEAFRAPLDEQVRAGGLEPGDVDAFVQERFPARTVAKRPPAPDLDVSGKVAQGIVKTIFGKVVPTTAAPAALARLWERLKPEDRTRVKDTLLSVKRAVGDRWWVMGDDVQTEIMHGITRVGDKSRAELSGLGRELGHRAERGEVRLSDVAEPVERAPDLVTAKELDPEGGLRLDSDAMQKLGSIERVVKESQETAAGSVKAARAVGDVIKRERAPDLADAQQLQVIAHKAQQQSKVARERAREVKSSKYEEAEGLSERADVLDEQAARKRDEGALVIEGRREATATVGEAGKVKIDELKHPEQAPQLREMAADARVAVGNLDEQIKVAKPRSKEKKALVAQRKELARDAKLLRAAAVKMEKVGAIMARGGVSTLRAARRGADEVTNAARSGKPTTLEPSVARELLVDARDLGKLSRELRRRASDIKATGRREAGPLWEQASHYREVAARLRDEAVAVLDAADERLAPLYEEKAELRATADAIREALDDSPLLERAGREAAAGLRKLDEPRTEVVEIVGDAGIIDRMHEAINRGMPPARGLKRETVSAAFAESLREDGLTLLQEPGVRGAIYADVAERVGGTKVERAAVERALDDAMVDVARKSLGNEKVSLRVKLSNGVELDLRSEIAKASRTMKAQDPARHAEWVKGAIERTAVSLGSMAAERVTAAHIMRELGRFDDTRGSRTAFKHMPGPDLAKKMSEGEAMPVLAKDAIAEKLDPANKLYVDAPDWLAPFVDKALGDDTFPAGAKVHKHALPALKAHVEGLRLIRDTTALVRAGRHISLGQTAYNPAVHKGNLLGNIGFEALAAAQAPVQMAKNFRDSIAFYQKAKKGLVTGDDLAFWRGLQRSGAFATSAVDDAMTMVAGLANVARTAGPTARLEKVGAAARRAYQAGDTLFKLVSARRHYGLLKGKLDKLSNGRSLSVQLRDERWVTLTKESDGRVVVDGGVVEGQALADILAEASTVPGIGRYFDYTSGGLLRKKAGQVGQKIPFLAWVQPYYSWPYFATDVPGVKKGLMTNIFDDAGGGYWRTDDPVLIKEGIHHAAKVAVKRAGMIQAGLAMTEDSRHEEMPWLNRFSSSEPVIRLAYPTGRKANGDYEVDIVEFRQEYPFQGTEMLWKGATSVFGLGGEQALARRSARLTPKDLAAIGMNRKSYAALLTLGEKVAYKLAKGEHITPEEFMQIGGYGAPMIDRVVERLMPTGPTGEAQPPDWDGVFFNASRLLLGGGLHSMASVLATDKTSPYYYRKIDKVTGDFEPAFAAFVRAMVSAGPRKGMAEEVLESNYKRKLKYLRKTFKRHFQRELKKLEDASGRAKDEAGYKKVEQREQMFMSGLDLAESMLEQDYMRARKPIIDRAKRKAYTRGRGN